MRWQAATSSTRSSSGRFQGRPSRTASNQGAIFEPADWRRMMEWDEALQVAVEFLTRSQRDTEPSLAIDAGRVRESNGLLIVPYNSVQYLASRDAREQLLDCWPILVDLERGDVRFGTLEERHLWKNPTT
ncbi:YrhB domain-containing protein [Streptomyces leeuwenhoekii]|uniref:YrhB domain-containing protein n=1 Tax=Streptomyces leeuwenhoekii TaxID=1437453 RepID=UPI0036FD0325